METVIRKIETVEELRELRSIFDVAFEVSDTKKNSDTNMDEILSREDICILGAFVNNKLAGGLTAYELPLTSGVREMYIYDLAVAEDYRKKGIATGLINELKKLSSLRNVKTIFVEAEADDKTAVDFYKSLGVEEVDVKHYNI